MANPFLKGWNDAGENQRRDALAGISQLSGLSAMQGSMITQAMQQQGLLEKQQQQARLTQFASQLPEQERAKFMIAPMEYIKSMGESRFSKVDAKDYTPESVKTFTETKNYSDLVPVRKRDILPSGVAIDPYTVNPGERLDVTTPHQNWQQNVQFPGQQALTQRGQNITLAGMNRPVFNESVGGFITPPPVGVGGGSPVPQAPRPGYSPAVAGAFGMPQSAPQAAPRPGPQVIPVPGLVPGAGKWTNDLDRGIQINSVTGETRPITQGGVPLAPKPSAARERELMGIAQQEATVQGALDAVLKTPSAFGFSRGAATMAGAMPESLAGRLDSKDEREARSYVFNVVSKVINERAGAAQSAQELARLRSFLPAEMDSAKQIEDKLTGFQKYLGDMRSGTTGQQSSPQQRRATDNTQGWSIRPAN